MATKKKRYVATLLFTELFELILLKEELKVIPMKVVHRGYSLKLYSNSLEEINTFQELGSRANASSSFLAFN